MKLSCIPICFFGELFNGSMTLSEWIRMAAEIGLDGIELYRPFVNPAEPDAWRRVADEIRAAGLEISMLTSYGNLAHPSPDERRRQVESLQADVDRAVLVGTGIVRVTAGSWPSDCPRDEALRNVAECLRRSLDYAEARGIMLALEDHPEIGTRNQDFITILDLVDDDRLKVNLDTSNPMEAGESALPLAEHVRDRVVHLHASDRDEDLEHQVVGEGCVPFHRIFAVLKAAGFDGWISLEAGGSRGRDGIIDGMDYVRTTWQSA